MKTLRELLEKNRTWAENINAETPGFFAELATHQSPKYLWIGCADSRVPANQIVDLPPGELFVHRNIANVVVHTDLNCLSVIQYAVDILKVKHIIICGHYGCGGIRSALEEHEHGLIDNWLRHIKDVARLYADKLKSLTDEEKIKELCELNIVEQVKNVCNTTIVKDTWRRGEELSVHGWIYSLENGILKDLDVCMTCENDLRNIED